MLFSVEDAKKVNRRVLWLGKFLSRLFFGTKYDLKKAGADIEAEEYLTASVFSAIVYGVIFFCLFMILFAAKDRVLIQENVLFSALIGFLFFLVFLFIHIIYPKLMAQKVAAGVDQSLMFALKSMMIQVTSGVSLFDAMKNIGRSDYGSVSKEFSEVVRDISAGTSEADALRKLALKTKSEYLKKTSWQLSTALKSGSSLKGALDSIITILMNYQKRTIKNYTAELNMWILVYLLLAAAVPTLGITFLVILSAIGGSDIGPLHLMFIVAGAFTIQIVLIGFIKTRVPKVFA